MGAKTRPSKLNHEVHNPFFMLHSKVFLDQELAAPLLDKDNGYLKDHALALMERAATWKALVDATAATATAVTIKNAAWDSSHGLKPPRIVIADAERSFITNGNRQALINFLTFLENEMADYAQGMGFFAAILLLVMDEERALPIVRTVAKSEAFIPGYWRAEAVPFAVDAYVFDFFLQKFFPKVADHLNAQFVFPEMFCQKYEELCLYLKSSRWFVGMCVHVLPFEQLFRFFEMFFTHGRPFLFQFGLSLVQQLEEQLLKADVSRILELLRLENTQVNYDTILDNATSFDVTTGVDYPKLRADIFEAKLRKRLESAAKRKQEAEEDSDDEIVFSDEEEEEKEGTDKKDDEDD